MVFWIVFVSCYIVAVALLKVLQLSAWIVAESDKHNSQVQRRKEAKQ